MEDDNEEFEGAELYNSFAMDPKELIEQVMNHIPDGPHDEGSHPHAMILVGVLAAQSGVNEHVHDVTMIYRGVLDCIGDHTLRRGLRSACIAFDTTHNPPKVVVALSFTRDKVDGITPEQHKTLNRALVHVINASEQMTARLNVDGVLELKVDCQDPDCTVHDHSKGNDIEVQVEQFRNELDVQLGDTERPFGRWGI